MADSQARKAKPFFSFIDGLRGVAVLSVLIFHLRSSWLPGGFLGVDIFFVISGFVVSHSVRDFRGCFGAFVLEFYRRRVIRILPPLIACLILTSILSVLFIPGDQALFSRISRAAHFAMSNFAMIKENANYFSPTADFHPLTHTWSLGIEEQFYLFFPFLFFFCVLQPRRHLSGIWGFIAIIAVSLFYSVAHRGDTTTTFYGFLPRMWELSIGVVAYLGSESAVSETPPQNTLAKSIVALSALSFAVLSTFQETTEGFSPWQAVAALSTGILLFLLRSPSSGSLWAKRLLNIAPLRWTGRISYSLYLFHWPVIVILRWTHGTDSPESILAATCLSFGLGALCYYRLERPMKALAHTPHGQKAPLAIAFGLGGLLVSSILTAQIYSQYQMLSLSVVSRNSSDWSTGARFLNADCAVQTLSENGATVYRRKQDPKTPDSETDTKSPCPENNSHRRLFVVGDSHAGAYSVLFRKLAERDVSSVHLFTMPGCTTFGLSGGGSEDCNRFIEKNFKSISDNAVAGDTLFLPGLRILRLTDYHATPSPLATPESFHSENIASLHRSHIETALTTLSPLLERRLNIVFEAPKPLYRISSYRCSDAFNQQNPLCRWGFSIGRDELIEYLKVPRQTLQQIADLHSQIHLWDPFPILCPKTAENTCSPLSEGRPLFYDYDHLSAYGNEILYPHLSSLITRSAR